MDKPPIVSSYNLFGAKITPTTSKELLLLLKQHVDVRRQCVIASQNVHGLHVRIADGCFERLHQLPQTYVHIDGMPLVLLCRLRGIDASRAHRVTLVDWIWPLLRFAGTERRRVFYLGGTDAVLRVGTSAILRRIPNLILRSHHGYFDFDTGSESAAIIKIIKDFRPDIVLVGMGMGRQEHWILENLEAISPASVCTVGACMEYLAGAVRTPPRWLGRVGLEWLFRFCEQPGRFWYRYAVEPWFVLANILRYTSLAKVSNFSDQVDHSYNACEPVVPNRADRIGTPSTVEPVTDADKSPMLVSKFPTLRIRSFRLAPRAKASAIREKVRSGNAHEAGSE